MKKFSHSVRILPEKSQHMQEVFLNVGQLLARCVDDSRLIRLLSVDSRVQGHPDFVESLACAVVMRNTASNLSCLA